MKRMLCMVLLLMLCMPAALSEEERGTLDYQPLKELTAKYGFTLGAPMSADQLANFNYRKLLMHHFDTITPTNELKAYSLLDQRASMQSPDGMPRMNFDVADRMVKFASDFGLKVRGHVLVWDAYMTPWFFHVGYDTKNPIADQETMKLRMQSYIEQVITHFEESFPGVVYCWDVVNEAVGDNRGEYIPEDPRHVRTVRNGAANPFYYYVGPDYVELAFLYARDVVEALGADIKLFYNDYNALYDEKRAAIKALVESINSYATDEDGNPRKLLDGVGMQGYIGGYGHQEGCMSDNDVALVRKSIQEYAALGVQVQLTEMSLRNYDKEKEAEHAAFYGKMFEVFCQANEGEGNPLTSVAIWGVVDCNNLPQSHYTWKLNGPYCGLFTLKLNVKESFKTIYAQMGGE
ncbi:MAG: endo-1,4-beta-xylanase [Clostridiales bacterium]|nr:endo-1,4-beta-xylanase [Clostridiales bacterium]